MTFAPERFVGAPLPALLQELAKGRTGNVVDGFERHEKRPPLPGVGASIPPTVTWPPNWLPPQDPHATTPGPTHPVVTPGDVTLGEYIGGGRQGGVYAGIVQTTGLIVAVKVIHAGGEQGEAHAVQEVQIGAQLRHPNNLRVFHAQQVNSFWVVVMEFLQGDNLRSVALPFREVESLAGKLASATLALARARIVHRDIKPANIVRRRADRSPVLIDFGLAVDLKTLTAPPGLAGTPSFMAPEVFCVSGTCPGRCLRRGSR